MLAHGINFTMRIITTVGVIIIGIGILFYVAQKGMSEHVIPTLQEYVASTAAATVSPEENQAQVAWLASSTIVNTLLPHESATSSPKYIPEAVKILPITKKIAPFVSKVVSTIEKTSSTVFVTNKASSLIPFTAPQGTIYVTVAKTPATREQGLSGYTSLGADKGMLFIFPTPDKPDFWMKDMNFSLDMIWITNDRKIIGVSSNISPNTYPKTFSPPDKIQFVLEVNAGAAEKFGLAVGTTVVF